MTFLSEKQITQFRNDGYLVINNIFDPQQNFAPIMEEYAEVLDRLAHDLFDKKEISSLYTNLPFEERLIAIYKDSGKVHSQYFNASLPPDGFTEDTPYWAGSALFHTLRHPNLLDVLESIVGSEICATPILHVRIKPPENLTPRDDKGRIQLEKTPIHQDNAGILPEADKIEMVTVWFPMNDTNIKNGCLCVWPGSHHLGLLPHCIDRGRPRIPTQFLKNLGKAVPVPVNQGGVLLMNKCMVHASYANRSDKIRWSFDLRYTPTHQGKVRDFFPDFIARSRLHPETELHDPIQWDLQWREARQKLAKTGTPQFHRW